jgi:cobalt-zinc-cadmium efflux system outer membrane protein
VDYRFTLVVLLLAMRPVLTTAQGALTLDATVRRALESHPTVAMAAERVRAARATRLTARSWTNPTFNYEVENEPAAGGHVPGVAMQRKVSAFAMVPLEPLYQLWPRAARAGAEVRRAEAELRDTRRRTALMAVETFHRAAFAQVAVDAGEDVRAWLDSLVRYTRTRAKEGVAAEADLIRLEVEQGRVETELALAQTGLARARAELGVLVGLDAVFPDLTDDSLPGGGAVALPPLATLLEAARRNRPDLLAAEAAVHASRAGVSVERSAIVGDISAMAGVMTMQGQRSLMAGVSLPVPLFDQNRGGIQRATAERRTSVFEKALVERQVTAEVTSTYAAVQSLSVQIGRITGSLLRRAEEGRRIAEGAYREGATPLVQVLDAARAYSEARMLYYRAAFAWRQSLVELNAAIGSDDFIGIPSGGVR